MANAFISVGALVSTFLPLAFLSQKQPDPNKQTQISLGIGDNAYAGGSMPHIAVWDAHGHRITQYKGNKNGHVGDGAGNTIAFSLDNNQNGGKPAKPEYISIVMHEHDGICLAGIVAASQGVQWVWTGDVGYTCGAQWYASKYTFGNSNQPIRCVWLDADHSNGVIAKGLSLHIRDFSGEAGLLAQYQEDEKRLCQNSARMTFYPDILPDSIPQFFGPPLEYKRDESMGDPQKNATAGALKKPDQGSGDRKTRAYPDGTDMNPHKRQLQQAKSFIKRRKLRRRGVKNLDPDRLTISHMAGHSAKELCDDSMSLGPDFISKEEGTFCDMETATLWPLCSASATAECFDLQAQKINSNITKRSTPAKTYKVVEEWK